MSTLGGREKEKKRENISTRETLSTTNQKSKEIKSLKVRSQMQLDHKEECRAERKRKKKKADNLCLELKKNDTIDHF